MYLIRLQALKLEITVGQVSGSRKLSSTWCSENHSYLPECTGKHVMSYSWLHIFMWRSQFHTFLLREAQMVQVDTGNLKRLDIQRGRRMPRFSYGSLVWSMTSLQPATLPSLLFIPSITRAVRFNLILIEASMWPKTEIRNSILYIINRPYLGFKQSSLVLHKSSCA